MRIWYQKDVKALAAYNSFGNRGNLIILTSSSLVTGDIRIDFIFKSTEK